MEVIAIALFYVVIMFFGLLWNLFAVVGVIATIKFLVDYLRKRNSNNLIPNIVTEGVNVKEVPE